ncbi:MAG: M50 family metallopeptidase [Coriobacteriales bacterium]
MILIVLVVVHELGHFVVAKGFGVRVTEFMIGLPGPSIGFERGGTRYGVTAIPFGGYNRIAGLEGGKEDPNLGPVLAYVYRHGSTDPEHVAAGCNISEEDAESALIILDGWGSINKPGRCNNTGKYCAPAAEGYALGQPRQVDDPAALLNAERAVTFRGLSYPKRLAVLFAGPLMNILLAVALFLVVFCGIGIAYTTTTVGSLTEGGPAQLAGMQEGDVITSVNGTPVESAGAVSAALAGSQAGDTVAVGYERAGQQHQAQVTITQDEGGRLVIGFYGEIGRYRLSPVDALATSGTMLVTTVKAYASLFNPATAAETISQSSSVVGISILAKRAADQGAFMLLYITGVVSLSLGIVNLLPFPPLDGGKIVTETVERVSRRYVPVRLINATTVAVMAFFMVLFVVLTMQDVNNFIL